MYSAIWNKLYISFMNFANASKCGICASLFEDFQYCFHLSIILMNSFDFIYMVTAIITKFFLFQLPGKKFRQSIEGVRASPGAFLSWHFPTLKNKKTKKIWKQGPSNSYGPKYKRKKWWTKLRSKQWRHL